MKRSHPKFRVHCVSVSCLRESLRNNLLSFFQLFRCEVCWGWKAIIFYFLAPGIDVSILPWQVLSATTNPFNEYDTNIPLSRKCDISWLCLNKKNLDVLPAKSFLLLLPTSGDVKDWPKFNRKPISSFSGFDARTLQIKIGSKVSRRKKSNQQVFLFDWRK